MLGRWPSLCLASLCRLSAVPWQLAAWALTHLRMARVPLSLATLCAQEAVPAPMVPGNLQRNSSTCLLQRNFEKVVLCHTSAASACLLCLPGSLPRLYSRCLPHLLTWVSAPPYPA